MSILDYILTLFHQNFQKAHFGQIRKALRDIKMVRVDRKEGPPDFYLQDALPQGVTTDHRIWRIKVGNKRLAEDDLLLTGGGAVVGFIPKGLPPLSLPEINVSKLLQMLPFAIIISLLGFMEAIAIAKAMAAKTGQRLDPNQELIGQGLANIIPAK